MKHYLRTALVTLLALLCGCSTPFNSCHAKNQQVTVSDLTHVPYTLTFTDSKYTLLHFWSTWCSACTHELSALYNFSQYFNENDIKVVMIALDSESEQIKELLEKLHLQGNYYLDFRDEAKDYYDVGGIPQTLLISRHGQVVEFLEPDSGKFVERTRDPQAWDTKKVIDYFLGFIKADAA